MTNKTQRLLLVDLILGARRFKLRKALGKSIVNKTTFEKVVALHMEQYTGRVAGCIHLPIPGSYSVTIPPFSPTSAVARLFRTVKERYCMG